MPAYSARPYRYPPPTEIARTLVGLGAFGAAEARAVPAGAPPAGPSKTTSATAVVRRLPAAGIPPGLRERMGLRDAATAVLRGDMSYLAQMGAMAGDALVQEVLGSNEYRAPSLSRAQQAALYGLGGSLGLGQDEWYAPELTEPPAAEPAAAVVGPRVDSSWLRDVTQFVTGVAPMVGAALPQKTVGARLLTGARPPAAATYVAPPPAAASGAKTGLILAAVGLAGVVAYMVLKRRREA